MNVISETTPEGTVVRVSGHLNPGTAPTLQEDLQTAIDAGASRLVLDLSSLESIDTAGLQVLLAAVKQLKKTDGRLVLFGLQPLVAEIVETSGFSSVLTIRSTEGEALTGLQQ